QAGFEVVCAGDVGHRDAFVRTLIVQSLIQRASRAVPQIQARIGDRDRVEPDARDSSLLAVIPALRVVRLDEELTAERVRVVRGRQVLRDVTVLCDSFGREDGTDLLQELERALARWMLGETAHELLFCRRLPREA